MGGGRGAGRIPVRQPGARHHRRVGGARLLRPGPDALPTGAGGTVDRGPAGPAGAGGLLADRPLPPFRLHGQSGRPPGQAGAGSLDRGVVAPAGPLG